MTSRTRHFWWTHAVLPGLALLVSTIVFEITPLDLAISDHFFDAATGRFPGRSSWWASDLLHDGGKGLVIAGVLAVVGILVASCWNARLRAARRPAIFVLACFALGPGLVSLAKHSIVYHCPWDVDRYGGAAPYIRIFDSRPPNYGEGHCFPAAHASGGFAWMALYFVLGVVGSAAARRRARLALAGALLLGTAFGIGQIARGAHFASHVVWAAAVCWAACLALYGGAFRGRLGNAPDADREVHREYPPGSPRFPQAVRNDPTSAKPPPLSPSESEREQDEAVLA